MTTNELTSESLLYGAGGFVGGFVIGWMLKKAMKILVKIGLAIFALFITGLIYLQSVKVIEINERAFDNFVNSSVENVNRVMGTNCDVDRLMNQVGTLDINCIDGMVNPIQHVITSLGIPMSMGLGGGILAGWYKG